VNLPTNLLGESRRPLSLGGQWLELWSISIDVSSIAHVILPVVNHTSPITFAGVTYYPFPISRGPIEWDSQASIPKTRVELANARRDFAHYLEQGHGFVDRQVTWRLVHTSFLASATDRMPMSWIVSEARINDAVIQLDLEARGFQNLRLPRERFLRDRCGWRFRSEECGYEPDAALGANYRDCAKSVEDCEDRGDDEVARGLPRLHPLQYGGFPAVPRFVR
jgi:lambda family phage minor tail protein L